MLGLVLLQVLMSALLLRISISRARAAEAAAAAFAAAVPSSGGPEPGEDSPSTSISAQGIYIVWNKMNNFIRDLYCTANPHFLSFNPNFTFFLKNVIVIPFLIKIFSNSIQAQINTT
jgi:hypothetical protein